MKVNKLLTILVATTQLFGVMCAKAMPYATYPYLYSDFEDQTSDDWFANGAKFAVETPGYASSVAGLRVDVASNYQSVRHTIDMENGKTYKISCYVKPNMDLITNTASFFLYFPENKNGEVGKDDGYVSVPVTGLTFNANEWTRLEGDYTFDSTAAKVGYGKIPVFGNGKVEVRFGNGLLSNITGGDAFSYVIDDFSVEPILSESTIEGPSEPTPTPTPEPEIPTQAIVGGDFSNGIDEAWLSNGAAYSLSEDVPGGDCTATNSMHVQQTAKKGYVYQNVSLQPEIEYKLSFYAKGPSLDGKAIKPTLEGSSVVSIPLPADVQNFTADWTYYESTFTTDKNIDQTLKFYFLTGVNLQMKDYYLANVSLARVVEEPEEPEETEEPEPEVEPGKYLTPEIDKGVVEGELVEYKSISINAPYLGTYNQTGIIQLFKQADDGGWASIASAEYNGEPLTYTFKSTDVGQQIKYRIVPMDTTGQLGGYREETIGEVKLALEIDKSIDTSEANTLTGKVNVINRSVDAKHVVCILMVYDEANSCIATNYTAGVIAPATDKAFTVVAERDGTAKRAKLFVWQGNSNTDTSMISLSKVTCIELE